MRKQIIPVAIAAIAIALISWSQVETSSASSRARKVPGLWTGTYNVDQLPAAGDMPYIFVFKPDGSLTTDGFGADGNRYYSEGQWKLDGDTLRCNYVTINYYAGPKVYQSAKFHFNKKKGKLSAGTWKDDLNGSEYTGKFPEMKRVK